MKNPAETNSTPTDLPSFLDAGTDVETGASDAAVAVVDDETIATDAVDDEAVEEFDAGEEHAERVDPGQRKLLSRPRETPDHADGNAGGGLPGIVFGSLLWLVAGLLGTVLEGSNAATGLERFGLTPATLVVLGGVLLTGGMLRRHLATLHTRVASRNDDGDDWSRQAQESLEFLVAAQHASNERPPAAGEELQHVLMAMQRQEEKINNLTKAIKMYAKPLMEISGQTTELAGAIAHAKTAIEADAEAGRQSFARLEAQLRDDTGASKERAELLDALHVIAADVDKLTKKQVAVSLEPLQQHIGRIEVAIAALSQRVESSEVQKSLLRLEDAAQKTRDEVHQLRGDGLGKATSQLQERLEKATRGLADGLQQMRDGNLGGLETGVREIQRELSGVATAVAQIQAIVRSGRTAATTATPVAAPVATPAAAAPAAPNPAPASPAPKAGESGNDANSGYQTGTRSTSGKNVLGAIAKLKQMKG